MSKFSYIMLGLVVTFSSFVLFSVHLGTTDAFVSAQTIIGPLDMGIGFPGTELNDSFTIECNETTDYKMTLITADGVEDLRPCLLVEKRPEIDSDGPISGDPDYSGYGSFTAGSDEEDTWDVTFFIPIDKVDPDLGLDYGCQIIIEPVIPKQAED